MTEEALQREATATIRGYIYQFDATILRLLELSPNEALTIEGVEDFDVTSESNVEFSQVKYYASQKLTDAVLRDAILPMLKGFLSLPNTARLGKTYILYGHFKEAGRGSKSTDLAELQRILIRTTYEEIAGRRKAQSRGLQLELKASDADLAAFSACLSIRLVDDYQTHKDFVISKLSSIMRISNVEARSYTYPTALTLVSDLASTSLVSSRTITGQDFKKLIQTKTALYNEWMLREEGEAAYCRHLKQVYFSSLNIDNDERFFVLSGMKSFPTSDLINVARWLVEKWSSYSISRKPNPDRYAPYLYIPDIPPALLIEIKRSFDDDGLILLDGHKYNGAAFDPIAIQEPQTKTRRIAVRFIETQEQLIEVIDSMRKQKKKLIVQMYVDNMHKMPDNIRHIAMPVSSPMMVKSIL